MKKTVTIDGVEYVARQSIQERRCCIVVLDRGWVFVGDRVQDGSTVTLTNCSNIRSWESIGFGGLAKEGPKKAKAVLDACEDIVYRDTAEIFYVPVNASTWK